MFNSNGSRDPRAIRVQQYRIGGNCLIIIETSQTSANIMCFFPQRMMGLTDSQCLMLQSTKTLATLTLSKILASTSYGLVSEFEDRVQQSSE